MEPKPDNSCVYGLGECPVLTVVGEKMKDMEQRSKVFPTDPGAAAVSQMIQPFLQLNANIYAMLPAVFLGSFGLVFKSFDKAEHPKEQGHSGCYVDS